MKGRLWLLNLLLLGCIALSASALRQRYAEARLREDALLKQRLPTAAAPALVPLPPVVPTTPASYIDIAQRMLFARDRNPSVILDPPPPPPPPKPMPELPVAYGVMDLGSGPTAILAVKSGAPSKSYRVGDKIGEFTLTSLQGREIGFDWEGQEIRKQLEELADKNPQSAAAPAPETPAPVSTPTSSTLAPVKAGPGGSTGGDFRACVAGDSSPSGTVQDGYKKVVSKTPFGESCRWEPAK